MTVLVSESIASEPIYCNPISPHFEPFPTLTHHRCRRRNALFSADLWALHRCSDLHHLLVIEKQRKRVVSQLRLGAAAAAGRD